MDVSAAFFNKVLMDFMVQATDPLVVPVIVITLLTFALISLLLDKIPTITVIGAHFAIFLFASFATHIRAHEIFNILVYALVVLVGLKYVGRFFAWLGMDEGFFGPRLWVLLGLGTACALTLVDEAIRLEEEKTKDQNWMHSPEAWRG